MNFSVSLPVDGCLKLCNENFIPYTCFPARDMKILVDDMNWLLKRKEGTESSLQALEDAGEAQRNYEVRFWLERVESTNNEVDALIRRLSVKRCGLFSCFSFRSNYKSGKEVQLLLRRIKILKEERGAFGEYDKLTIKRNPSLTTLRTQLQGTGEEEQQRRGGDQWHLFCSSIKGGTADVNDPLIQKHAKAIVSECRGLPLALVAVGRAVRNYQSSAEWEIAVQRLKDTPASHESSPSKQKSESTFRFCYDSLDNDQLRSCLLHCCLYPKKYIITESRLTLTWMGEGLLDQEDGSLDFFSAYEKGLDIIRKLNDACLLDFRREWCDFYLQVPDDVWDMAQHISDRQGNPYFVYSKNSEELSLKFWDTTMRISIAELDPSLPGASRLFNSLPNLDTTFLSEDTPCNRRLTTFFAYGNRKLESIDQDFFHFIPCVRVLELSNTNIKELPTSINLLTQLQYLMVDRTNITKLPIELGDLKKLRMLGLSYTVQLKEIPSVSISKLSALQSLRLNESGYLWDLNEEHLMGVGHTLLKLDDLIKLRRMQSLWLKIVSVPTLELLLKSFVCITGLTLSGEYFDGNDVEKIFKRFLQMRWLELHNCTKLQRLELTRIELRFLQELKMTALENLSKISSKDGSPVFPFLRHLGLWRCNSLEDLTWAGQLPVLELLCVSCCKQVNQLIVRSEEEPAGLLSEPFPKLQFLVLNQLPELSSFSWKHPLYLPSLRTLRVIQCPQLTKLPLGKQSGSNISEIRGSQEWWDELEWDDEKIRSTFLPHFQPK